MPRKYTTEQRVSAFWSNVNKNGSIPAHCPELGNCWEWQRSLNNWGYGTFHLFGKQIKTHRIAWELANGEIPDSLWVLHKCDNPACVNPDHLFLGTHQDNVNDREVKGRSNRGTGERSSHHKITMQQAMQIRKKFKNGVGTKELALNYNISRAHIYKILSGKIWKE